MAEVPSKPHAEDAQRRGTVSAPFRAFRVKQAGGGA